MSTRAEGTAWAIATPHHTATEAGAASFERGGNSVDAALAAATVLAVVYPHMCGVGGDLFALVQAPDGAAWSVNSSGRAPSGLDVPALRRATDDMPAGGPDTVTVPGAVAGWAELHRLGARRPWAEAFADAIRLASDGAPVSGDLGATLAAGAARLADDPGLRAVFYPGGTAPSVGDQLRQPALGAVLDSVAAGGAAAFYGGEAGSRYVTGLRELGVRITEDDLVTHRAQVLPPLAARYRDLHVSVAPPNSQGFALLELLALIERLGIDPDPDGPDAGTIALAARAASVDRDLHLADPSAMRVHPHTLLDDGHLADVADRLRDARTDHRPHRSASGDTVAIVAADRDGHAVSLIQSLFDGFGAGFLEPSTGIVPQSRGACFTLEPGHANEAAPGKLPAHTLLPVLVERHGDLVGVAGTMGGFAQPQIDAAALIRAFDLDRHPAEAVAAPRWLASGMDRPGDGAFEVDCEPGVSERARSSILAAGATLREIDGADGSAGHAHLIVADRGRLLAGADPRSDGSALAG